MDYGKSSQNKYHFLLLLWSIETKLTACKYIKIYDKNLWVHLLYLNKCWYHICVLFSPLLQILMHDAILFYTPFTIYMHDEIHCLIFFFFQLQFGIKSCFHSRTEDAVIRITMGWVLFHLLLTRISTSRILGAMSVIHNYNMDEYSARILVQILCSYVTLPIYALVTQVIWY